MDIEVEFLFDNQLIAALEDLIRAAKHRLVLVSPYIDLDARISDALSEKKYVKDFDLTVLFGKNEKTYISSLKRDSLEFFKQFPQIEIRYNERLHAKFYQNDSHFIMTSMNLYDYSLANNIEVGVRGSHALKGMIGKALDASNKLINEGVDKVKQEVFGLNKAIHPIEKFQTIIHQSTLVYKTKPKLVEKGGLQGMIGMQKLEGFNVVKDELDSVVKRPMQKVETVSSFPSSEGKENKSFNVTISKADTTTNTTEVSKHLSASQLSKKLGVASNEVTALMQLHGFVNDDKITEQGIAKGLLMKNYMGKDYISYPEDLPELKQLKK